MYYRLDENDLEPWQIRLQHEHQNLQKRISRLYLFLSAQALHKTVTKEAYELIQEQLQAMKFYADVLERRMEHHKIPIAE